MASNALAPPANILEKLQARHAIRHEQAQKAATQHATRWVDTWCNDTKHCGMLMLVGVHVHPIKQHLAHLMLLFRNQHESPEAFCLQFDEQVMTLQHDIDHVQEYVFF